MLHTAASLSRLGTESAFEVLARANQLAAQGRNIINLGIGQPDFRTPAHIVEAGFVAAFGTISTAGFGKKVNARGGGRAGLRRGSGAGRG